MNDFSFYSPTRIVFGKGVSNQVGSELARAGFSRALVVYGGGSALRNGALERVRASLQHVHISFVELGGVRPNPEIASVYAGIEQAREHQVDIILAVGGGSAMDCAKAIALGVPYSGDVWDFYCKRAIPQAHIPVAAVVTIPASGSEASDSCVISNDEVGLKCGVNTELNRPVLAFLDPELTYILPAYQTACGITDMISHILERFFSGQPSAPVTDNIACGIIRAVIDAAHTVSTDPHNYDARATLMWAGTLAHNGLCGLGLGVPGGRDGDWSCHGLEHELSALNPSIAHGAGLAVIIPAWMRKVWHAHPERFLAFGKQVFDIEPVDPRVDDLTGFEGVITDERALHDAVEATIDELQEFFVGLGMPANLTELGIGADDIDRLLEGLRVTRGEVFGSFMPLTLEDAREIYRSALA